ncbi:glycine zipper domain-containing protein [Pararhodospirillum oryzae]|uniref:Glycine zipper domain-containing protein n=1 Tax=Pararhodospirillum oryzae TaxID=478448 RepID=A0A512H8E9_9PROT|nr:glycine zipper domain-containing protein [Pararhodospirillum oryzae]GEO81726.1 hypothetical protein ROR02_18570 [Pararhodospirillum oryzae]
MTKKGRNAFTLIVGIGFFLAACTTTGSTPGGTGSGSGATTTAATLTSNERQLATYAGEDYVQKYAVQAGLVGAVGGAGLGCLIGHLAFGDCGVGAAIGAGVGGLAGAAVGASMGRETEQLAQQQLSAEQALVVARDESKAAEASNRAARALVAEQTSTLRSMRQNLQRGKVTRQAYAAAIEDAKQAEKLIGGSRDKMRDSIVDIQNRIRMERENGRSTGDLERTLKDLRQQEASLDKQLAMLTKERETSERALTVS